MSMIPKRPAPHLMLAKAHGMVFSRRVRVLARHLSEMLPRNATVLDVGAGGYACYLDRG